MLLGTYVLVPTYLRFAVSCSSSALLLTGIPFSLRRYMLYFLLGRRVSSGFCSSAPPPLNLRSVSAVLAIGTLTASFIATRSVAPPDWLNRGPWVPNSLLGMPSSACDRVVPSRLANSPRCTPLSLELCGRLGLFSAPGFGPNLLIRHLLCCRRIRWPTSGCQAMHPGFPVLVGCARRLLLAAQVQSHHWRCTIARPCEHRRLRKRLALCLLALTRRPSPPNK